MKSKNLKIGDKYNNLTVLKYLESIKGNWYILVRCDCGKEVKKRASNVKTGHTKSCGCLQKQGRPKHGKRRHPLYSLRFNILQRCNNEKHNSYQNYGARGIKVCEEWTESFELFYEWCMKNGYEKGLQIDRIDNDGNYEPSNCRFVDTKVNQRNKRNNNIIIINNESKTLTEWCEIYNLKFSNVKYRVKKGDSYEEAILKTAKR